MRYSLICLLVVSCARELHADSWEILFCRKIRARLIEAEMKAAAAVARGEIAILVDQVDGELEDEAEVGAVPGCTQCSAMHPPTYPEGRPP